MAKDNKNISRRGFDTGRINFVSKMGLFGVISTFVVIGAVLVISTIGLKYGIDFAGGTEVQVKFAQPVQVAEIRSFLKELGLGSSQVQSFGDENEFLVRFEMKQGKTDRETNEMMTATIAKVTTGFEEKFSAQKPDIRRVDSVGPQVGSELKRNGILAVFYSLLLILIYIGLRFDYNYAPGAVVCLFHDSLITLGILALVGKEINVQILAAILTIIGYSLNDTIVIFDRIRENMGLYKDNTLKDVINRSINETLARTLTTSFTTLIAVLSLYIFAGGVIRDFAFAMGIGVVIGTYSSIFIASPLVIVFERFKNFSKPRPA